MVQQGDKLDSPLEGQTEKVPMNCASFYLYIFKDKPKTHVKRGFHTVLKLLVMTVMTEIYSTKTEERKEYTKI